MIMSAAPFCGTVDSRLKDDASAAVMLWWAVAIISIFLYFFWAVFRCIKDRMGGGINAKERKKVERADLLETAQALKRVCKGTSLEELDHITDFLDHIVSIELNRVRKAIHLMEMECLGHQEQSEESVRKRNSLSKAGELTMVRCRSNSAIHVKLTNRKSSILEGQKANVNPSTADQL